MLLKTYLKKYFDVDANHVISDTDGFFSDEKGFVQCLDVYEKGNDVEPAFILYRSNNIGFWIVGNIYSKLIHHKEYSESELKAEVKKGVIKTN